ncbi:MAG TPA: tyrosine-type recombinase/integrase, partial [Terriglobales bacterium]|nr:tyrosine-type recombinase/integrase [Terriglobales bacterium]
MTLTNRSINALKPPKKGNEITYDGEVPGFGVRITSSGVISYILNYRIHNRERRYTIGRHPEWTLPQARNEAIRLRGDISIGKDPLADRERLREAPTVKDLCDDYIKRHALPHKRENSVRDDKAMIDGHILPSWGRIKVEAITRRDVEDIHRSLKATRYKANRLLSLLSKMFSLAVEWNWRVDNPTKYVKEFDEQQRDRWLNSEEVEALAKALDDYPGRRADELGGTPKQRVAIRTLASRVVAAIRLLMVTGARKNEVLSARWEHIDLDRGVWTKPSHHTKQKRTEHVPLSDQAMEIIKALPVEGDFLFPGRRKEQPLKDVKFAWGKICEHAKLENVRIHDLRHTFASHLVSNGESLPIVGRLLGHT